VEKKKRELSCGLASNGKNGFSLGGGAGPVKGSVGGKGGGTKKKENHRKEWVGGVINWQPLLEKR